MGTPQSKPQVTPVAQSNCLSKLFNQPYSESALAALTLFDLTQLSRVSKQLAQSQTIQQKKYQKILQALTSFLLHPLIQQDNDCHQMQKSVHAILEEKTNLPTKIDGLVKIIKKPLAVCVFEIQQCVYRKELIDYEAEIVLAPEGGLIPAWSEQQSMFRAAMARQMLFTESPPLQFILDCPVLFDILDNKKSLQQLRNIRQAFKLRAAAERNDFAVIEQLRQENIDINFASKNKHGNFPATVVREPDAGEFPDTGCPLVGAIINNHNVMVLWLLDIGVYVSPAKKNLLQIVLGSSFLFDELPQHVITAQLSGRKLEWHAETIQQIAALDSFKESLFKTIQGKIRAHRLQLWQAIINPKNATLISKLFHTQLGNYIFSGKGKAMLDKIKFTYQADERGHSFDEQRRALVIIHMLEQLRRKKNNNPCDLVLEYCDLPRLC